MLFIDRQTLTDLLSSDVLNVTFTKKDNEQVMRCTLRNEMLPKDKAKAVGEEFSAYDLDKQEWGSFSLDSIVKITPGIWA